MNNPVAKHDFNKGGAHKDMKRQEKNLVVSKSIKERAMRTSEIKMVPYVTYTSERLREFQDQFNGTGIFYDTLSEIENDVKSDINDNDFIIRMF